MPYLDQPPTRTAPAGEPIPEPAPPVEPGMYEPAYQAPGQYANQAPAPAAPAPSSGYVSEPLGGKDVTYQYSQQTPQGPQDYTGISDLNARTAYVPEPQPASTYYGGADPNAPPISTGLVETIYPARAGRAPTSRVVPSSRQAAYDVAADDWWRRSAWHGARAWRELPIEQRPPPPAYSPYNTGSVPGGVGNLRQPTIQETGVHRARYRLDRPAAPTQPPRPHTPQPRIPTASPIQPIPLPVTGRDPGFTDFMSDLLQRAGVWPNYSFGWQRDLGVPLSGPAGSPPRQSG